MADFKNDSKKNLWLFLVKKWLRIEDSNKTNNLIVISDYKISKKKQWLLAILTLVAIIALIMMILVVIQQI
ncbi:hypothetical protein MCAV_03170 [[Mycoplasma] cavipharyngis]|uniref:hypothetical protein n=1 Tax=[Mycoplasma] cavipharyngis TaxID=92757 RepID=UPI0037049B2A